jgi:aspartyl-tRNA(Asn)/glutamyl-tRNA(Gln) amidotransferase subunit B
MDSAKYDVVIGLEIHAQLKTQTKLFCGCSTAFGRTPNSLTCPVCLGLPGALPVLNERAVEMAVLLALAVRARVHLRSQFSRKNYFYPDLPKGYQITQYLYPIASDGWLSIGDGGTLRKIGIERLNLEEDAGKSIHDGLPDSARKTSLDFNRSGVPLVEIVGRPELTSPAEAVAFLDRLRTTVQYLEICDGNMEQGSLRCDANLSVKEKGSSALGVKTEIKNLNSFKFLERALAFEAERQIGLLEEGLPVLADTRLYDAAQNRTLPMRTKEEAQDYRYFPEPDLPLLVLGDDLVAALRARLPELPEEKVRRFVAAYGLSAYEACLLAETRELADYFERTAAAAGNPREVSHWIMREVRRYLNDRQETVERYPVRPEDLGELIRLVETGRITLTAAKEKVLPQMIASGRSAALIVKEEGLAPISDEAEIRRLALRILGENPGPVRQYREGKKQVFGFLVGQLMKASAGRADARRAQEIFRELLAEAEEKPR